MGRSCSACPGILNSSGCLWERRCCHWVASWRCQLFGRLLLALLVLMLSLLLVLLLLLLEVMLGPRIWRVELLRRRAMPQARLLLLLQGRSGRSTGRSHGLAEWRRGVGTLLAACMMWVSKIGEDMTWQGW